MNELIKKSAEELASLIRKKEISSTEVIEAHINRINEVNPQVNAITVVLEEDALAMAKAADNAPEAERKRPFHGVPITIKENIDYVGVPTTNGLTLLQDSFPPRTAPVVERMMSNGAIPIGRTNLPELGLRLDTDNPLRGRTYNPWDKKLTPGGSSGGEAAAISSGMSPFGLGNDIGGSLRNPAYCCGIASLKPSIGRIPNVRTIEGFQDRGIAGAFYAEGPMARSVRDLKNGLLVMAGRHIDDPQSITVEYDGFVPDTPKAAIVKELPNHKIAGANIQAIEKAAKILDDHGWIVEEVEPPEVDRVYEIWHKILNSGMLDAIPEGTFTPQTEAYLHRFSEQFHNNTMTLYEALVERDRLRRIWSTFLDDYQICIGPTWANRPWPIDTDLDPDAGIPALQDSFIFITPGNCLGLPSVALPMDLVDGLPSGIQIYSGLYREDLCLSAAEIIQNEVPCPSPTNPS